MLGAGVEAVWAGHGAGTSAFGWSNNTAPLSPNKTQVHALERFFIFDSPPGSHKFEILREASGSLQKAMKTIEQKAQVGRAPLACVTMAMLVHTAGGLTSRLALARTQRKRLEMQATAAKEAARKEQVRLGRVWHSALCCK